MARLWADESSSFICRLNWVRHSVTVTVKASGQFSALKKM